MDLVLSFHAHYGKSDISPLVADLGTATHSEALEPEKGNVVLAQKKRATKAFKEHYEECKKQGKVLAPERLHD